MENELKKTLRIQKLEARSSRHFSKPKVIKQSDHSYRSRLVGPFFSDFDEKTLSPETIRDAFKLYLYSINEIFKEYGNISDVILAFIDKQKRGTVGAIRYATQLSDEINIPQIIVRPWKELTLERIKLPPEINSLKDKKIILVTDHITTSGEVNQAIRDIENLNGKVTGIVTHTVMSNFLPKLLKKYPNLKIHHKLPDDLPYSLKNQVNQKRPPSKYS